MRPDPQLPEVFTRPDVLAAGLTRHQIRSRLSSGRWITLRRGAFCLRETFESYAPNRRHLLHASAARLVHRRITLVDSHLSAAGRWDLPMPLGGSWRAYLTDGCTQRSTRLDEHCVIEVATLLPGETTKRGGFTVTSPARTAADCLRHYDAEVAVPIADAAIRQGLTSTRAVEQVLERQERWPLAHRGEHSLGMVDGRRESWLESLSAVRMTRAGLPVAESQVTVMGDDGRFIGRTDFLWEEFATVGEADGASKYSLGDWPELSGASAADLVDARVDAALRVVRTEKAREDGLRGIGLEVVRWSTSDILKDPTVVAGWIRAAHRRGNPSRFIGRFAYAPRVP